jgi:ABC-type nitrate/sulfonate/bicarbonate transport system permease component
MKRNDFQNWTYPAVALIVALVGWEAIIHLFGMSPLILPSPIKVAAALTSHCGQLFTNGLLTFLESILGFIVGSSFGIGLAILFLFSAKAERALYPYAIAMKAIPLVALAPIVVVWLGGGMASKVVLSAIISFFPVLVNAIDGLKSVEPEALELMRSLSASRWQTFVKYQWPNALPQLFAGLKVASSFSVVGCVVAEFVNAQAGIGFLIKSSSYYLDTDITFAAIFVAALIGILFFGIVVWLQTIVVFWKRQDHATKETDFETKHSTSEGII